MGLPRKLKYFNWSVDNTSYYGEATEVTQPKLAMKLEEFRGGGMIAPVDINMGLEKLEIEFKIGGHETELIKKFGGTISGTTFRFNGAYQRDDTDEVDAVELVCRGRVTEIDEGTGKSGDDTEHAYKGSLTYYKKTVNGEDIVEIDTLGMIFKIGGVDRLEEIRRAIGL
ncbi:phage major tail tube protein [Actinobacillus equuli subsp. haemolyticus]|uniref:Phage major tail tube protein n=1 Tax=Actinobacillus equuli subsp. equuli TaxID=202947 RepID=A0A9X4G3J2_ACTEU|nr:phage major tail tube protein [Actinobacillus equuli]MDE8034636.1 phage major tail tube protein [Actinobacillus equuli subsp. equuli]WGE63780.1 phage major tail tube protein [Actinobacillus equuli subsp. haemolyticus]